jgi:hypothetical protein
VRDRQALDEELRSRLLVGRVRKLVGIAKGALS